jgi:hypothetical protein
MSAFICSPDLIAAAKAHALVAAAARNGGLWISAAGGTANIVAGEIARATGVSFDDALWALDATGKVYWGRDDWYAGWADAQPWRWEDLDAASAARFSARTVARAACRG